MGWDFVLTAERSAVLCLMLFQHCASFWISLKILISPGYVVIYLLIHLSKMWKKLKWFMKLVTLHLADAVFFLLLFISQWSQCFLSICRIYCGYWTVQTSVCLCVSLRTGEPLSALCANKTAALWDTGHPGSNSITLLKYYTSPCQRLAAGWCLFMSEGVCECVPSSVWVVVNTQMDV